MNLSEVRCRAKWEPLIRTFEDWLGAYYFATAYEFEQLNALLTGWEIGTWDRDNIIGLLSDRSQWLELARLVEGWRPAEASEELFKVICGRKP